MSNSELESDSTGKQVEQLEAQPTREQTNSLNQQRQQPPSSPSQVSNQNANSNPLNDHDYCSPNKGVPNKSKPQQQHQRLDSKINHNSTTDRASTSKSPTKALNQKVVISTTEPINNSASSSASSPCSSERSNGLVIAQDHESKIKLKLQAAQQTLQVKRKPGRPPVSGTKKKTSNESSSLQDSISKPKRDRPARQSTSVTDKSQWIVGDDEIDSALSEHVDLNTEPQREKRQRIPKELDSAFSQYTSSDYSSSDAESVEEDEEEEDSCDEDDPNRLWCICQKPHDGKFMICCDICKDWFHGQCVGVPKLMGDRFEREGKEWFCSDCQEKLKSGIPRAAIPEKIVKNAKKKKKSTSGRRGRGRPRKSESSTRELSTRLSLRSARKSTSSLDPKMGVDNGRLKRNLSRTDARSESYDEFQDSQRLKELIRERKKAFFYKRQLAAEQKAAKRNELGLGTKQTLTASMGDSLDSLATSTSSPNMSNLPINIKERPKPNIVLQINMKKDPSSDQNDTNSRIVTTIVRSSKKTKQVDSNNPAAHDLFAADPIQINKKSIIKPTPSFTATNSIPVVSSNQASTKNGAESGVRKRTSSTSSPSKKNKQSEHVDGPTPKKKRKDSESSLSNGSATPFSEHVIQKIKDTLEGRVKEISDLKIGSEKIEKIATEIEVKLSENFKDVQKYKAKFYSILFNLRDKKNLGLVKSVLTEAISPSKLVNMSSEELASSELAKWRERENKHSIELIKRDAQLAAQQVIVKKTHKGEEVISAPLPNEPDDPSVTMDSQETPTTPNKLSTMTPKDVPRIDSSKIILTPPVIKPPTIKSIDLDSLPPVECERSPNHPDRSPGLEEYEQQRESSSRNDEVSNMFDSTPEPTWSGLITMPDIEKFSVSAKPVCGLVNLKRDQISETLAVCGRIPPDQVQSYLKKLKATTKHQVLMIQLFPLTDDDKPKFDVLFDYLYSRNRYGVIQTNPQLFKDFYIIPIHDKGSIPEALKPTVTGPGIDRKEPNCLIGLLVKFIRRQSTSVAPVTGSSTSEGNAVYTP